MFEPGELRLIQMPETDALQMLARTHYHVFTGKLAEGHYCRNASQAADASGTVELHSSQVYKCHTIIQANAADRSVSVQIFVEFSKFLHSILAVKEAIEALSQVRRETVFSAQALDRLLNPLHQEVLHFAWIWPKWLQFAVLQTDAVCTQRDQVH